VKTAAHESAWYAQREALFSGGNEVTLLTGGDQLFPAMREGIARAHHDVWLATYIFHDDAAARAMATALIDAARRGVRVRVVVDGFGSKASLPVLRRWFDGSGVALAVFRPVDRWCLAAAGAAAAPTRSSCS
jgi:cardiolipin synthase